MMLSVVSRLEPVDLISHLSPGTLFRLADLIAGGRSRMTNVLERSGGPGFCPNRWRTTMAVQLRVDRTLTVWVGPYRLRSPPPRARLADEGLFGRRRCNQPRSPIKM